MHQPLQLCVIHTKKEKLKIPLKKQMQLLGGSGGARSHIQPAVAWNSLLVPTMESRHLRDALSCSRTTVACQSAPLYI